MKSIKNILSKAVVFFIVSTMICGVFYTGIVTVVGQFFFPKQVNGSLIEVDGKTYGSALLGQQFQDEKHMWGRIMNIDVSTYTDENKKPIMYASPSNISPASKEYEQLMTQRVALIKQAHPYQKGKPIPVDLVTCSGSGLDPHISIAAAKYQVKRLADANGMSEQEINSIIEKCSEERFLGIFGEKCVNVLKVNLMIEKIL